MEKEIFVWREATYRVRAGKGSFYPLWSENGFEAWRKFRAEKRLARLRIILSKRSKIHVEPNLQCHQSEVVYFQGEGIDD